MRAFFKEFFLLCVPAAILSFILFVLLGNIYDPFSHSIFLNIIVWFTVGIIPYILVFIPFYNKKKNKYIDGFVPMSSYGVILIICLFRSKQIEDYLYVTCFLSISSIVTIIQLFIWFNQKKAIKKTHKEIEKEYSELFKDEENIKISIIILKIKKLP